MASDQSADGVDRDEPNAGDDRVLSPSTVTCTGCEKDYRFDTRRHAIEFISTHKRYLGHEPELKGSIR